MNKKLLQPALTLFFLAFLATGCKKYVHENITAASNSSLAISVYNDVFEQINAAVDSSLDEKTTGAWLMNGSLCANVTLAPVGTTFPKTLTIDYGIECQSIDGVMRAGKIIAVFDGNFEEENTIVNVSFDNYTAGQHIIAGTDSIVNTGTDSDGNPTFSEFIENATIALGSETIRWSAELNRTWTEGDTTNFNTDTIGGTLGLGGLTDDVFTLMGNASGNDSRTHPFNLEITEPLMLNSDCKYITSGMLTVSPANFNTGNVDYGDGTCDQQATMEVDGEVFNFTQ